MWRLRLRKRPRRFLALGSPGPHGRDARQGSDRAGAAQRQRPGSIREAVRVRRHRAKHWQSYGATPPRKLRPDDGGWHHPRSTHQASRGKRRAPENRLLEILTKWGIRSLGALTALSGPEIHERLGERGALWQSLARGVDARPMVPWVDEVPFEAALELEWPIEGLEPLSFVLARLLEPLAERLERADRGAAVLYTSLRLTSRTVFTRTLQLPAPMRDPKTLRTLILLDLESHPPDAPIDIVRVFIEPTPAKVLQWTLLERAQPAPEQVSTLIARLTALDGRRTCGLARARGHLEAGRLRDVGFRISDRRMYRSRLKPIANRQSAIDPRSDQPSEIGLAPLSISRSRPAWSSARDARFASRPIDKDLRAARSCKPPVRGARRANWWATAAASDADQASDRQRRRGIAMNGTWR